MKGKERVLLGTLRCGIKGEALSAGPACSEEEWKELMSFAKEHDILPLIYDTVYQCPTFRSIRNEYKKDAVSAATRQITQTNEFLTLVLRAQARGLDPVVLKGIICRDLYPRPMLRPSVDEDLLIDARDTERWHWFLLSEGLSADEPDADRGTAGEFSYHRENSPTYIELHKSLFSESSAAYGDLNDLFKGAMDRTVTVQVEDVTLRTLAPTDHFLFLLCHAYKHFLHGGVGIRQVADMALYANAYGGAIDWRRVFDACSYVHIETFAAALLRIAHKHLTMTAVPVPFAGIKVDEGPLLEDIISGGAYGTADVNRVHSSNITLDAVAARRQIRERRGVLHSIFPGSAYLKNRFPYAKKRPILMPVAWVHRILEYLCKSGRTKGNPVETVHIGQARIELMKQYRII